MAQEFVMLIGPRSRVTNRRFVVLLLGWVAFLAALAPSHGSQAQSAAQTVRLVIDYGDGVLKIFDRLPWSNGNTVLDALNAAKASAHGITFSYTGNGKTAFLTDIDGLQNQGGGTSAKNWQYWVNTSYADRSFAVFPVQAADTIFWRFTTDQSK